jgi:hypothetical protein
MANKIIIAILFVCVFTNFCQAQLPLKFSNIIEGRENDIQFILPNATNKTFILNKKSGFLFKKDKWFIDVYDDSTLQRTNTQELFFAQKSENYQQTVALKNNQYLFTNSHNNNTKKLIAYSIKNSGAVTCVDTAIAQIKNIDNNNAFNFNIYISNDSSKIWIMNYLPASGADANKIEVSLFDTSLNKIGAQKVLLPNQNRETRVINAIATNNNIAFLLQIADDDKLHLFSTKTFSYSILNCNISNGSTQISNLKLQKKSTVICSSFFVDKYQNIGLCGFQKFGSNNSEMVVMPFFQKILPQTNQVQNNDFLDDYAQPNTSTQIIKDSYSYNYQPLLSYVLNNGNVMLINEKAFTETACITDYRTGAQRCNFYYHNDNIDGFEFDELSEAKKIFTIEKRQISINDDGYFLGATHGIINNNLVFIYNDSKKNEPTKQALGNNVHYMNSAKKSNVVLVKIDPTGNVTKQLLFSNSNNKTVFVAQKSMIFSNGKIVLYCKRNNKYSIAVAHIL